MLVDAAKQGDVEIPYFCYEPKLGKPGRRLPDVPGRGRGHPQAADLLLDPGQGRDGRPHPDRARPPRPERDRGVPARQPPARLPGLRQGRRVPAAGHHLRLGPGPQPLHRAQAPLREAAGPVAAGGDRPRALHPLLPLRALLPGDRRGLPADLHRARRPHLRRHPRRPPLRGAVQRQHHRAVPGGRADIAALPVPCPPVGHRGRRRHLHAVPLAVQRHLHGPRRARHARAGARSRGRRRRLAVRQGPLRLPGDPRRRADHPPARARRRRAARGVLGARAADRRPAWRATRAASGRLSAARPPTRRASCSSASAARPWTPPTSTRGRSNPLPAAVARTLAAPELQASVPDIEFAHTVLVFGCDPREDSPILDLRIRKGVRRNGVKLAIATARPTALEANAVASVRYAPGADAEFAAALARALDGATDVADDVRGLAGLLRDGGEDVVVIFSASGSAPPPPPRCIGVGRPPGAGRARGRGRAGAARRRQRPRAARGRRRPRRRSRPRRR